MMRWTWIHSSQHQFNKFRNAMIKLSAQPGYEIDFVYLSGGKNAIEYVVERTESDLEMASLLFSDVTRALDVFDEDGLLNRVQGYGAWIVAEEVNKQLLDKIEQKLLKPSEALALLFPPEVALCTGADEITIMWYLISCLNASAPPWTCYSDHTPQALLQYVPARNVGSKDLKVSLTQIRPLIWETGSDQRWKAVAEMALNAELLLDLVQHGRSVG